MAQINFSARNVAPNAGFETLPNDWYKLMADESEIKPTKAAIQGANNDWYLNVRFTVLEGLTTGTKLAGRKVFKMFNLKNSNEQAQKIAEGEFSALCHAVGVLDVADSAMLHNIPLWARVKVRKAEEGSQYDDQNNITTFKHISDPPAAAVATGAPNVAPTQQFTPPPQQFAPPAQQQGYPQQGQWQPPAGAPAQPWNSGGPAPNHGQPPQGQFPNGQPAGAPNMQQPASAGMPTGPMGGAPNGYPGATGQAAPGAQPAGGNPAGAPPQPWNSPAGGQPWQAQPPQQPQQHQPATPPVQQQPPHPAQSATPPWHNR